MLLDTDFVIDLHREVKGGKSRGALAFLAGHGGDALRISLITWMEFAEGLETPAEGDCRRFLSTFLVLPPDVETAWLASRIAAQLRKGGRAIGDHDIWIAATAMQHGIPLVSRNSSHFGRVPGLKVLSY